MKYGDGWNLTYEIVEKYTTLITNFIIDEDVEEIDLTGTNLSPYQLWKILEDKLGYEENDIDNNGWEQDFWIEFNKKENEYFNLVIDAQGMTFSLKLYKRF